jgi:hypothetical protein
MRDKGSSFKGSFMQKLIQLMSLALLGVSSQGFANGEVEFYKDVMPLIESRCITCHSHDGVSFSYENADEAYALRMAITDAVANDRMPPWLAEPGHQSYMDDFSLTAAEKSVFVEWAAAGYPRAEQAMSASSRAEEFIFDADLSMDVLPVEAYLPDQNRKDDYRCFVVDWPYDTDMYVTGFMADPGNLRIAHHLVNYAVGPEGAELLRTLSEEEEGPGHQCFGGPLPDRLGDDDVRADIDERFPGGFDDLVKNYYWLSHWAPGMYGLAFPENSGVLMRPGSVVVVQMHYFSAFAPGESDLNTTMHFKIAGEVDRPSINHPLSIGDWVEGKENGSMFIPAGESKTYETSQNIQSVADYAAHYLKVDPEDVAALEIQSANVHMHAFGAAGRSSLLDGNGVKETLLNIPRWDLNWQRDFMFTEGKIIPRADFADTRLIVECTFSNYTNDMVYGGYGSDDEMCFNFSYVALIRKDGSVASLNR